MRLGSSAVIALSLMVAAACGSSAGAPVERAQPGAAAPTTSRPLPQHAGGAVRGTVEVADPEAATPPRTVLVFGDSVARLVVDDLARVLDDDRLVLDAQDCRRIDIGFTGPCGGVPAGQQAPSGREALTDLMADLRAEGVDLDAAVIVLANNSGLTVEHLDDVMATLVGVPVVAWVNARIDGFGRQDPNNRALDDLATRDGRATIVDWFGASADQDWLSDHVHPNDAGQTALGALVAETLDQVCDPTCADGAAP